MKSCMATTGPCSVLLQTLKNARDECDAPSRIGTLGFDAMSLTPAVRYEESNDRIGGFEEIGDSKQRTHKVANQGMAAAVRTVKYLHRLNLLTFFCVTINFDN
jgi:hypothetical protein